MSASLDTCLQGSEFIDAERAVFVRKVILRAQGVRVGGHAHNFDHVTEFRRGRVRVSMNGVPAGEFGPGETLLIEASVVHDLEALDAEGAEFWCVYAFRDATGAAVETYPHDPAHIHDDPAFQCR